MANITRIVPIQKFGQVGLEMFQGFPHSKHRGFAGLRVDVAGDLRRPSPSIVSAFPVAAVAVAGDRDQLISRFGRWGRTAADQVLVEVKPEIR